MELISITASHEERFFWENDYVGKPVNFYHGAAYQIPVIEGEIVDIQCKVRAVSEDPYTIIWDYENFHANTTGKTVLVNNTDGDEYAQDTITVTIDNPADIDDRDIICSWENGKFSDTITLQFKVYVRDNYDSDDTCEGDIQCHHNDSDDTCEGAGQLKLRRPVIQKKEDINLEEKIKQKLLRDYNVGNVLIDSDGYINRCNSTNATTTITITTTSETTTITTNTTNPGQGPLLEEEDEEEGDMSGGAGLHLLQKYYFLYFCFILF